MAVVPFREDPLLKRAREQEEDRYNAKRRKVTAEEKKDALVEKYKEFVEKQPNKNVKDAVQQRRPLKDADDRVIQELFEHEYQRRSTRETLDQEIKRFNAEIERMPLAELKERVPFTFGTISVFPVGRTVQTLSRMGELSRYIDDRYWHLTAAVASELDSWKRREQELERFEEDTQRLEEKDRLKAEQREKEEEIKRFMTAIPLINFASVPGEAHGWEVHDHYSIGNYLMSHDYKSLTQDEALEIPEFRARFRAHVLGTLPRQLRRIDDEFLAAMTAATSDGLHFVINGYDWLTADEIRQAVIAEFNRRGLRPTKPPKEAVPDLLLESKERPDSIPFQDPEIEEADLEMHLQPAVDVSAVERLKQHIATRTRGLDDD